MNMYSIFSFLLIVHIIFGFTALVTAFGALSSRKGQARHRLFGKIFFYAMNGILITAIPLALMKSNLFLFLIAIFSYYLAFSGWRYAKNPSGVALKLDWVICFVMLLTSLSMLSLGLLWMSSTSTQAVMLLVFGVTGFSFSIADLKTYYRQEATGNLRIAKHLGAMLGATIATVTAFSVTNIPIHPAIFLWLGPTVLFVPIILWWKFKVMKGNH